MNDTIETFRRQYDDARVHRQPDSVGTTAHRRHPARLSPIASRRSAPVAASTIDITMTGPNNFFNRHAPRRSRRRARLRPAAARLQRRLHRRRTSTSATATGGVLINRITSVGWILDRTESDLYPRFIQTGGPDFTNPANYRPDANGLANDNNEQRPRGHARLRGNVRYELPIAVPVFVKAGVALARAVASELQQHVPALELHRHDGAARRSRRSLMFDQRQDRPPICRSGKPRTSSSDAQADRSRALARGSLFPRDRTSYTGTRA